MEYNVKFEHIEGQKNIVADALSQSLPKIPQAFAIMKNGKMAFDYTGDAEFEKVWGMVQGMDGLVGGNLRIGELVCVPETDRLMVLKACHEDEGHLGAEKLYKRMKTLFYWRTMHKDCVEFTRTCQNCQANKTSHQKPAGLLHPLPAPSRPMEHVAMDFFFDLPVTEGGWSGVWLIVDRFSKLVKLIPVKKDMGVE